MTTGTTTQNGDDEQFRGWICSVLFLSWLHFLFKDSFDFTTVCLLSIVGVIVNGEANAYRTYQRCCNFLWCAFAIKNGDTLWLVPKRIVKIVSILFRLNQINAFEWEMSVAKCRAFYDHWWVLFAFFSLWRHRCRMIRKFRGRWLATDQILTSSAPLVSPIDNSLARNPFSSIVVAITTNFKHSKHSYWWRCHRTMHFVYFISFNVDSARAVLHYSFTVNRTKAPRTNNQQSKWIHNVFFLLFTESITQFGSFRNVIQVSVRSLPIAQGST